MVHLEGKQSVTAALGARRRRFEVVLLPHGAHEENVAEVLAAAEAANVPVKHVARDQLDAMAHGKSHGGVIAVCSPRPKQSFDDLLHLLDHKPPSAGAPLLLLLEGVDDARNLGFTLRSAEAFGADAVLIKKHLWDFDETEVARPSSGAYERLPLVQFDSVEPLHDLKRRRIRLYGCIAGVKRTIYNTNLVGGVCLAIGGEKRGLSGAVRKLCDRFLTIPTLPSAPSLSLSAAAATVLSESHRQRLTPPTSPTPAEEPAPDPTDDAEAASQHDPA